MEVKTHKADENPCLEGIACGLRSTELYSINILMIDSVAQRLFIFLHYYSLQSIICLLIGSP